MTRHGFAWNVTTDLSAFDLIVPCGIPQVRMTSVERETGRAPAWETATQRAAARFAETFGLDPQPLAPEALPAPLPTPVG